MSNNDLQKRYIIGLIVPVGEGVYQLLTHPAYPAERALKFFDMERALTRAVAGYRALTESEMLNWATPKLEEYMGTVQRPIGPANVKSLITPNRVRSRKKNYPSHLD